MFSFLRRLDLVSLLKAGDALGIRKAVLLRCGEWFSRLTRVLGITYRYPVVRLHIKGYANPVHLRLGSSDPFVLDQIFVQREYSPLDEITPQPKSMIDCGANIGLSAFYFLNRYPGLRVVVVEPDPENLQICERNLSPFAERVHFVRAGVWSRRSGLVYSVAANG